MKLSKFDIGGEIISILTRGMYPDPKDAIREYIQNGIDAKSADIQVKVRQNSVVVHDYGIGMNKQTMRKAVRIGVSDKNPTHDVGFMGIGIYSAFHLCDTLTIYSNKNNVANKLEMDFKGMKSLLEEEQALRLSEELSSEERTDLQTLLEKYITLTEDGELAIEEFPIQGTRVEMINVRPTFHSELSNFDTLAGYLKEVVPLHFDSKSFKWANHIETYIKEACEKHDARFEVVNIDLQVNNRSERLYRPYHDTDFHGNDPLRPVFHDIKAGKNFFGVAWGCLNSERRKISNREQRGFLLRKQGFAVGRRENLVKHFTRGNTFFDRYIGEAILVNKEILPNSSRSDLEYSPLRTLFYKQFTEVADKFDEAANTFQERSKAKEKLRDLKSELQKVNKEYSEFEEDPDKLVRQIVKINEIKEQLKTRQKSSIIDEDLKATARMLQEEANSLESLVQNKIFTLAKKPKQNKTRSGSSKNVAKNLSNIKIDTASNSETFKEFDSIIELLEDLELEVNEDLLKLLKIIDEKFIQGYSENRKDYYKLLNDLKEAMQA